MLYYYGFCLTPLLLYYGTNPLFLLTTCAIISAWKNISTLLQPLDSKWRFEHLHNTQEYLPKTKEQHFLQQVLNAFTSQLQLSKTTLLFTPTSSAHAVGTGKRSGVIFFGEKDSQQLKPDHALAVLAHEVAHIHLNHYTKRSLIFFGIDFLFLSICGILSYFLYQFYAASGIDPDWTYLSSIIFFWSAGVGAKLMLEKHLQKLEFQADAFAAHLCGAPILSEALESLVALQSQQSSSNDLTAQNARSYSLIQSPIRRIVRTFGTRYWTLGSLFALCHYLHRKSKYKIHQFFDFMIEPLRTHPTIEARKARLMESYTLNKHRSKHLN